MGVGVISFKVVEVTPRKAEEYLRANNSNRPLSKATVARYVAAMRAGEWVVTHEGIAFDTGGRLIDGQHRLMAVVVSGVTVRMLVASGVAPESFDRIGDGKPRSLSDLMSIEGIAQSKRIGAAVSFLMRWRSSDGRWMTNVSGPRKRAAWLAFRVISAHPRWEEIRREMVGDGHRGAGCTSQQMWLAIRVVAMLGTSATEASAFFDGCSDGAGLSADDSRLLLRNRLMDNRISTRRMTLTAETEAIVRAWNAWVERRPMRRMQIDGAVPPMLRCVGVSLGIDGMLSGTDG